MVALMLTDEVERRRQRHDKWRSSMWACMRSKRAVSQKVSLEVDSDTGMLN